MKIIVMVGTRPEVIKVALVVKKLKACANIDVKLCATGQHRELLQQSLADFELEPDFHFDLMRPDQSLATLSADLLMAVDPLLEQEKPDWLLVQGDTTTVMASALSAFYRGVKIGHIEAGLRTYLRRSPFPEEINRQIVSRLSDLHFTPTPQSSKNLLAEGISRESIIMTGNTVIDSLMHINDKVRLENGLIDPAVTDRLDAGLRMVLVTGHRRENFGQNFKDICQAIVQLAEIHKDIFFVYPVHLNPNVQEPVRRYLGEHPRIILLPPLGYKNFIATLSRSYLILTDSGGIQEEAPSLGIPVLVMRDSTERPEGLEAGVAILVGSSPETIISRTSELLLNPETHERMAKADNPYGDGLASERIVQALLNHSSRKRYEGSTKPDLSYIAQVMGGTAQ